MTVSRSPVLWFGDPECDSADQAGGKGAGLAKMHKLGLPVPPGFVIRASVLGDLIEAEATRARIEADLSVGADSPEAASIRSLVDSLALPEGLVAELEASFERLDGGGGVAVRSSACAEDSETASFAGQHETHLNVREPDDLLRSIRACWASFFSERAVFYRARRGSLGDLGMAVVIQRQLRPERSGVMFTIDPIGKRRDRMMIEAVWGLGEAVVSGRATPDHYLVSQQGAVMEARVSVQEFAIRPQPDGGVAEHRLSPEEGGSRVLFDAELGRLADLGRRLESHFGRPQDVEWAFEGERLYLLQSRPVTA